MNYNFIKKWLNYIRKMFIMSIDNEADKIVDNLMSKKYKEMKTKPLKRKI
jgi:hypothetical protein